MSKTRIIFIFGVWVAILSYLGFPIFWKNILYTFTGLILVYFSYSMNHKNPKIKETSKKSFDNFSENHNFHETRTETAAPEEPSENIN